MLIEEITRRNLLKGVVGAAATGAAVASKADMFAKSYEQGCQIVYKKGKKYRECNPRAIELSDPIPPEYQRKAIDYYNQALESLLSQMPDPEAKSNQDYAKKVAIRYTSKAFGNKWMYVNGSWQDPDRLREDIHA